MMEDIAPSLPPSTCSWSSLQEDKRDRRLAALGLVLYTPESVLICRPCGYALQPKSDCVIRHLANKHATPKHIRDGLARFIRSLHLPDPNTLSLRPDWSPAYPDLASHVGVACRHYAYRTTSADLITRHLAKAHDRRRQGKKRDWLYDEVIQGVVLQSWTQNGARGYWIATQDPAIGKQLGVASSRLREQATTNQRAILDKLYQIERDRLACSQAQDNNTSVPDLALQTNWIRRTGWLETFDRANRGFLVRLAQPPCLQSDGLRLSIPGDGANQPPIWSLYEDEVRLSRVALALRGLQDRCEDTARHTDVSTRFWLRSADPVRPYRHPFQLVGRQTISRIYWRLFLRFLCFPFRLWRLSRRARASYCRRSLTQEQCAALQAAWSVFGDDPGQTRYLQGVEDLLGSQGMSDADSGSDFDSDSDSDIDSNTDSDADSYANADFDSNTDLDSNYDPSDQATSSSSEEEERDDSISTPDDQDALLQLASFLVTEPFQDGQASSTLLVYFSGVAGLSVDGSWFERPSRYTPKLSALIYCARLILLETALPRFAYRSIRIPARPRHDQLRRLNKIRARAFCIGSHAPVGELLGLRSYGRKLARSDGPAFYVQWSNDDQILS
ncbi:hypothetical protein C7999DRAFT_45037 [Corynascus novoguineensis]|uniref:Uncharacterized protein n=1 Tax=Corynascus novoguineensis TaxID=1126955 RepID=A0AAN7CJ74_9PEZI|nr:hypothetical protein C7999DRAFT_45037 [Corynascus novoguineensis]